MTTAPRRPRHFESTTAKQRHGHLFPLLTIAALVLAISMGVEVANGGGSAALPTQLTSYELEQLDEIKYLLWLDKHHEDEL